VLFGLLTLEAVLGIVALRPGQPVIPSIMHQVGAIAVLVAALAPPDLYRFYSFASRRSVVLAQ
jgi:heme A synthase